MTQVLLAAAVVAMATAAAADAAPAPAVRAEIERGSNAAFECYQRTPALAQSAEFAACAQKAHADNRQRMGHGYEAFDAGLYFRSAQYLRIKIEVLQDGDPGDSNLATLKALLGPLEAACDAADAELHISYDDVRASLTIE